MEDSKLQFDVLLIADMSRGGDIGLRIRRELQVLAKNGYRCALRHLPTDEAQEVSPDVQRSVREALAKPLGADQSAKAKLAIAYSPGSVNSQIDLTGITADQVLLVVDSPPEPKQMGYWFGFGVGPTTWAPTNRWVRGRLEELGFPVPIAEEDWRAIAVPCRPRPEKAPVRTKPVVGCVSTSGGSQWSETAAELDALYGASDAFDVWMLGGPPKDSMHDSTTAGSWTVLSRGDISVERFIEAVDLLVFMPGADAPEIPETALVAAMASGKPVVIPHRFKPLFGGGAVYAEPGEALTAAAELLSDGAALEAVRDAAREHCRWSNGEAAYLARVEQLIGPPEIPALPVASPHTTRENRRVLFVPSSGVGLGHTTRLLAIARRLDDTLEPVFASLGQAGGVFASFGYGAEYIPSASDSAAAFDAWDAWFRHELGEIIDRYDPAVVVFDGNNPTPGLVQAALAHGASRFVWVRRGMCPDTPSPYLGNAKFFDCIIEPGEHARDLDRGPTARLRHEVVEVPPVRLLDDAELLSREAARQEMGLDPDRPAVLVQPGSGANRDIVDLTDRLVSGLQRFDGLQIVIAEWSNGAITLPHWPGTKRLRGFPISRLFAGFDFSVSAAGYNTFHELIAHGLPTIFVANRHPSMDRQGVRAEFAQDNGAGFDLNEDEMHLFPTLCRAMLNPEANAVLREGCAQFDRSNGALSAAEVIKGLAGAPI